MIAEGREHPRRDVGDRYATADTGAALRAGDADHAALGLHDQIEGRALAIRAVLAEPRHGAIDDARVRARACS